MADGFGGSLALSATPRPRHRHRLRKGERPDCRIARLGNEYKGLQIVCQVPTDYSGPGTFE